MTDKEKFRKEEEKLKSNLIYGACSSQIAMETRCKEEAYNEVLAIINSNKEETASGSLEDAASYFARKDSEGINNPSNFYYTVADKARIFKAGANWQKQQMMKDATEVTVHIDACNYPYIPQIELYDYDKDVPLAKEGDKYKVILIKKEQV